MAYPEHPPSPPQAAAALHLLAACRQRCAPALLVSLLRGLGGDALLDAERQHALAELLAPPAPLLQLDADYRRRVLRAAVLAAEQDGQDVGEELMRLYSACLLGQPASEDGAGEDVDGGANPLAALLPPPPPHGWCYKLWSYAPAGEPPALTLQRLTALEQQVLRGRRQQLEAARQAQALAGFSSGGAAGKTEKLEAPLPLAPAAAGDARHGLLALHVSLNLLEGGTGCHEWEAGFFLAEWVLSRPHLVAGRCCLEVGCGTGMVGVALHRCGASRVILTDGDAHTVANCRRNLQLNGVPLAPEAGSAGAGGGATQPAAECRQLCWEDGWPGGAESSSGGGGDGAVQQQQEQQQRQPTVVLGADLLYDPTVIPTLLSLLAQVLAAAAAAAAEPGQPAAAASGGGPAGAQQPAVYLATTLRNEATLQQFLAAVRADAALSIQQLAGPAGEPGSEGSSAASAERQEALAAAEPAAEVEPAAERVCFLHLPELEAARGRIFLHRITLAAP